MKTKVIYAMCALVSLLAGCATTKPYDYTNFRAHRPRSILVLPPINQSTEVQGTYSYLSTVTAPLAERGYYVFPVAVVDELMKENGMPTAGEMHQVSLDKVAEKTGADAVMFITLNEYGSKYRLLSSGAVVAATARLVDTRTGTLLWEGTARAAQDSSSSGNLIADMIAAAIVQGINKSTDAAHNVSRQANAMLFNNETNGLLYGPYNPKYASK
jgi:hypothetical protein